MVLVGAGGAGKDFYALGVKFNALSMVVSCFVALTNKCHTCSSSRRDRLR
jgi:hypothetical protein